MLHCTRHAFLTKPPSTLYGADRDLLYIIYEDTTPLSAVNEDPTRPRPNRAIEDPTRQNVQRDKEDPTSCAKYLHRQCRDKHGTGPKRQRRATMHETLYYRYYIHRPHTNEAMRWRRASTSQDPLPSAALGMGGPTAPSAGLRRDVKRPPRDLGRDVKRPPRDLGRDVKRPPRDLGRDVKRPPREPHT